MEVEKFVEIALARSVLRVKHIFAFYAEIQDGRQSGGKRIFVKFASRLCKYSVGQKFCRNHSISHR